VFGVSTEPVKVVPDASVNVGVFPLTDDGRLTLPFSAATTAACASR